MDIETPYHDTLTVKEREVFAYLCSKLPGDPRSACGRPPPLDFGPSEPTMVTALLRRAAERDAGQHRTLS
jgi:hypothetical protein